MKWTLITIIAAVTGGALGLMSGVLSVPASTPCPTEDSVSCYWDASTMGNGTGASFTVDATGNLTYWKAP